MLVFVCNLVAAWDFIHATCFYQFVSRKTERENFNVGTLDIWNNRSIFIAPFIDFLQQYYSNSLGAGALNKPFWVSLVKIFAGSSKIFKDPQRSPKICKGLVKILEDKDLLKILTDPRGFLEDPIRIY